MVPMTTSRRVFDGEEHDYILAANMEGDVARYLNVRSTFLTQHASCHTPVTVFYFNHF